MNNNRQAIDKDQFQFIPFFTILQIKLFKKRCQFFIFFTSSLMKLFEIPKYMNFVQHQAFGNEQPIENIEQQDIINTIQFDSTGELLAVGDNAGRIILFKEQEDEFREKKSFEYYSEFQSHQPQFDSLKSMAVSESISHIKWLRPQDKYHKMITSNDNCIKLWKMFEKVDSRVVLTDHQESDMKQGSDLTIPLINKQTSFTSKCQVLFPVRHQTSINQAEATENEEYLFSTDEQRALMCNFEKHSSPFIVEQIKYKKNWKEGQKIACSKLHPKSDNIFTLGTTKGRIQLNDLRTSLNNRKNTQYYFQKQTEKTNDYFREMTTKINSLQFLASGKYIVARDYLTVKIWDLCRTSQPVSIIQINPGIRDQMCYLFENDCIEDQFQLTSFDENLIVTGNYNNKFHVVDPLRCQNIEYGMDFEPNNVKKQPVEADKRIIGQNFNQNKKVLACGVHRQSKKIALASLNSFFIYSQQIKQYSQGIDIEM